MHLQQLSSDNRRKTQTTGNCFSNWRDADGYRSTGAQPTHLVNCITKWCVYWKGSEWKNELLKAMNKSYLVWNLTGKHVSCKLEVTKQNIRDKNAPHSNRHFDECSDFQLQMLFAGSFGVLVTDSLYLACIPSCLSRFWPAALANAGEISREKKTPPKGFLPQFALIPNPCCCLSIGYVISPVMPESWNGLHGFLNLWMFVRRLSFVTCIQFIDTCRSITIDNE